MRKEVDFKIGETSIKITQLPPRQASKVSLWLIKVLGGSLGNVFGSFDFKDGASSKISESLNFEKLGGAITLMLDRIEEEETEKKLDTILSSALIGGQVGSLDHELFTSQKALFEVLRKCVEVNFQDFFGESSGLGEKLKKTWAMMSEK